MTKLSNNNLHSERLADRVLYALGDDAESITVQTFANLVGLCEDLTAQHVSSPTLLMHEKSRLSQMHANEKDQINSSDIVKGVKNTVDELQQYKNNAKEYDVKTNSFI